MQPTLFKRGLQWLNQRFAERGYGETRQNPVIPTTTSLCLRQRYLAESGFNGPTPM